jgi:alanine racemase
MSQPNAYAKISLDALASNYRALKMRASGKTLICVLKANAYGHGALECAKRLESEGAEYFAVANLDEARELREGGVAASIIVLGFIPADGVGEALDLGLTCAVYSMQFARALSDCARARGVKAKAHVKVDTGMNRLGFKDDPVAKILAVGRLEGLEVEGLFSHMATSDEPDRAFAETQLARFSSVAQAARRAGVGARFVHVANTGGLLYFDAQCTSAVRCGIGLYGLSPSGRDDSGLDLTPALTFCARVANVSVLRKGEGVGYAQTFHAPSDMRIATICAGYADGYIRAYSNKADAFVRGKRARIVGNVCMDMSMIDVTHIDGVAPGDEVELFGENVSAWELAGISGSIAYEVLCLLSKRVKRIFV